MGSLTMKILTLAALAAILWLSTDSVADEPNGSYFAVIVNDINVSAEWYMSTFGLAAGERMVQEGRYEIVNLQKPGLFVELLELDGAGDRANRAQGFFKAGFLTEDLDAFIASLPDSVSKPSVIEDSVNKLRLVQLKDPDGNTIQVMQLEARSEDIAR